MLAGAQTRIQDWWVGAHDGVLGERFRLEAQASLPLVGGGAEVEEVYAGVRAQRLRLRFDFGGGGMGGLDAMRQAAAHVAIAQNRLTRDY